MLAMDIQSAARQLKDAHGNKAIAEAAQKAVAYEHSGDQDKAQDWRRIEAALKQMQGPHVS